MVIVIQYILMKIFSSTRWHSLFSGKQKYGLLTMRPKFFFSEEENILLVDKGTLSIRNSQTFELKLQKYDPASRKMSPVSLQFTTLSTLTDLAGQFKTHFNIDSLDVYCQDGTLISNNTPVDALLNRVFIITSQDYRIKIEGQFLHSTPEVDRNIKNNELKNNLHQLQLPVVAQRQIESYMNRVDIWLEAKHVSGQKNAKTKLKTKDVQDILVQSILDPEHRWKVMAELQQEWEAKYWEVVELREKKQQAELISLKMARRRMFMGMGLLIGNTAFIWSGTYVFWSWDIIEPIAYFMSSFAAIALFGQALKLRKPFSLENYLSYLSEKQFEAACKQVGVNLSDLKTKEQQLQVLECTLKDYLIIKL